MTIWKLNQVRLDGSASEPVVALNEETMRAWIEEHAALMRRCGVASSPVLTEMGEALAALDPGPHAGPFLSR